MNIEFLILIALLAIYAFFSGALMWHLEVYSFTRKARLAMALFSILAIIFMASAIIHYFEIPWGDMDNIYKSLYQFHA